MSYSLLVELIAQATGEACRTIRQRGFSLADPMEVAFDPEPADESPYIDWDDVAVRRHARLAIY